MKPKIHIWATNIGRYTQDIRVMLGDDTLVEASDVDYESTDASTCCNLLVELRKAGVLDFTADEAAVKQWPALANVKSEPRGPSNNNI